VILLVIKGDGQIEYEDFDGDFDPSGYSPSCPECKSTRTMYSMLVHSIFSNGWMCTNCGVRFQLRSQ